MALGGIELYILAGMVFILVVAALAPSTRYKQGHAVVRETGERWLDDVAFELAALRHHRVDAISAGTLRVSFTYRPVWTVFAAVFLFPFGLLALVITRTEYGIVQVTDPGPPARVRMRGHFTPDAIGAVNKTVPSEDKARVTTE